MHMAICYGPVISKKTVKDTDDKKKIITVNNKNICDICYKTSQEKLMSCLDNSCSFRSHLVCLSAKFLEPGEYVPIVGNCPKCELSCLWGDLVKKYKGFYKNLDVRINCDNANDFASDDSDF